ncbi:MAG: squalene synthase HpnC [Gammaproteobacteria bacterium]|nr:squalene synthase HpnC [Gammaproteobacteria bacterium]
MARSHYENFPVASRFLPKRLREPIAVIYAFARTADDFADEGDLDPATRIAKLNAYDAQLDAIAAGDKVDDPVFVALADIIRRHDLPMDLFHDLLTAFRMDVTKKRHANYAEVLYYCRHSANPVGRLLLYLYNLATPVNLAHSDAICSALQLINFWQDLSQDYRENNRIYLPQEEMVNYGVSEDHLRHGRTDAAMRALMDFQIERTRRLLLSGAPLGKVLPGRMGFELRLTLHGGLRVLNALEARRDDAFARPRLGVTDWLAMLRGALFWRTPV